MTSRQCRFKQDQQQQVSLALVLIFMKNVNDHKALLQTQLIVCLSIARAPFVTARGSAGGVYGVSQYGR